MTSRLSDPKRLYNGDSNPGQSSERQPLHENFSDNEGIEDPGNPPEPVDPVVDSLIEKRPEPGDENKTKTRSYAVDPCFQNTSENPYRETTVTVPHLIRRVPSSDLVPMGWRSINRVIIGTYISIVFCCITGALANRYAWKAKRYQSKGLYGLVQRDSRRAVILIYTSIGLGITILIIVISVVCSQQKD